MFCVDAEEPPNASQVGSVAGAEVGANESNPNGSAGCGAGDPTLGKEFLLEGVDFDFEVLGRDGLVMDLGTAGLGDDICTSPLLLSHQVLSMYFL